MAYTSDAEAEGAENQLLTGLDDPLDAGDPDGKDRPPRYASASDFSFLPKDLKIITDGGPGAFALSSLPSWQYIALIELIQLAGCGGVGLDGTLS